AVLAGRADEGQVLAARDVVGVGSVVVAARQALWVELDENAFLHALFVEAVSFRFAAVAPDDIVGLTELDALVDPAADAFVDLCGNGSGARGLAGRFRQSGRRCRGHGMRSNRVLLRR